MENPLFGDTLKNLAALMDRSSNLPNSLNEVEFEESPLINHRLWLESILSVLSPEQVDAARATYARLFSAYKMSIASRNDSNEDNPQENRQT